MKRCWLLVFCLCIVPWLFCTTIPLLEVFPRKLQQISHFDFWLHDLDFCQWLLTPTKIKTL